MSEAIGRCGGDEKMNGYAEPTQSNVKRIYGEEDAWLVQRKLLCGIIGGDSSQSSIPTLVMLIVSPEHNTVIGEKGTCRKRFYNQFTLTRQEQSERYTYARVCSSVTTRE